MYFTGNDGYQHFLVSSPKINEIKKKITDHDHSNKHITTQEFNKLTVENFAARSAEAKLITKPDIPDFVKTTNFDDK